jgi:hypothetical protein
MKIRTSLPITRIKHINQPKSPELESPELTPIEKYKEVQKQDWQIEALIIGSIILGLAQIPDLMNLYYLEFADVFGIKATDVEMMLNIPFALLLIHMLFVLFIRSIWIIEAFGPRNIDRMNELNEMAGAYFGSGILYFLILLSGVIFWILLIYFVPIPRLLVTTFVTFLSCISYFIIVIRMSHLLTFPRRTKLISFWTLGIINPFTLFFINKHWNTIGNQLIFQFRNKFGAKIIHYENTLGMFSICYILYLMFYTGIYNSDICLTISANNSPIILEDERFSDETLWLFVHCSAIDKIREKTKIYFGEDELYEQNNYQVHRTLPDIRKLRVFVNGKLKTHTWRLNYQDVGAGLKTYLRASEMKKGFNDIRIKTYREGRWTLWDFSVYKP